jgi:hypothetical protein
MARRRALQKRVRYATRASRAVIEDPREGVERIRERIAEWRERRERPHAHPVSPDWHARLHELEALDWPCAAMSEHERIWADVIEEMHQRNLTLGRGTFGGWDDASKELSRAVFCAARNLRPSAVVETGVARGVTSRFILEALEQNGHGALWSVDLPPLIDKGLEEQTGIAVPDRLRRRWVLVRGSSRCALPGLLEEIGQVDLFVHDSIHTGRNVRFELDHVWPHVSTRGVVIVDDVDYNSAFAAFVAASRACAALVGPREPSEVQIGAFGVIVNGAAPSASPRPARPVQAGTGRSSRG